MANQRRYEERNYDDRRDRESYGERDWNRSGQYGSPSDESQRYGSDRYGSSGSDYGRDQNRYGHRRSGGDFGYRGEDRDQGGYGTSGYGGSYGRGSSSRDTSFGAGEDWRVEGGLGDYGRGGGFGGFDRSEDYGRRPERYGNNTDRSGQYGRGSSYRDDNQRGLLDRAGDEVASWFGDEDASRRREDDHRGKGPRNYTRSDDRIREDVNDHLTNDYRVDASDIDVSVENREVTLTGHVSSRAEKRRAEDCAEAVSGVSHVQNNLRVREDAFRSSMGSQTNTSSQSAMGSQSTAGTTQSTLSGSSTRSTS